MGHDNVQKRFLEIMESARMVKQESIFKDN